MKVDVYLNLHKDCVSVRSRETEDYGTVVAHRPKVHVKNVEFVVQEAGRQKVLETGRKNVHAFVRGNWDDNQTVISGTPIVYDPYEGSSFVERDSGRAVEGADLVAVTRNGVSATGVTYADETEVQA